MEKRPPDRPARHRDAGGPRPAEPERARSTVEIPRVWLAALAGGLVVALLLVAFLAGREAGRHVGEKAVRPTAVTTTDRRPEASVTEEPAATPWTPAGPGPGAEDGQRARWNPAEDPDADRPLAGRADAADEDDPQRAAVAAYFAQIEGYERQAKYWSDPQQLAMALVGEGVRGETSGLRQLLESQRVAQRQIESMTVPPVCGEHHRRTVALLDRALALLEGFEGHLASGDVDGLLALSGEAGGLESEAREVDALAAGIKRRFGLSDP